MERNGRQYFSRSNHEFIVIKFKHFPLLFFGDFLYFFKHVYIKIIGYLFFSFAICSGFFINCLDHMCNNKGKMYHVILNLYNNVKSRIVYKDYASNFYPCLNGVRQGVIILHFVALYLNNWETFLTRKNAQGVKNISVDFETNH